MQEEEEEYEEDEEEGGGAVCNANKPTIDRWPNFLKGVKLSLV